MCFSMIVMEFYIQMHAYVLMRKYPISFQRRNVTKLILILNALQK